MSLWAASRFIYKLFDESQIIHPGPLADFYAGCWLVNESVTKEETVQEYGFMSDMCRKRSSVVLFVRRESLNESEWVIISARKS